MFRLPDSQVCSSSADLQVHNLDDSPVSSQKPLSRRNSFGESPQKTMEKRASEVALDFLNDNGDIKRRALENAPPFAMPKKEMASAPPKQSSSASVPPPTPSKQRGVAQRNPRPAHSLHVASLFSEAPENSPVPDSPKATCSPRCASPFFILNQKAVEEGSIEINQQTVHLTPFSEEGSYMRVYTLDADYNVINGVSNGALVIKIYHGVKNNGFEESVNREYLQNSKRNYFEAMAKGLPVAFIYNSQTVSTDLFILQEKIPYEIDVNNPHQIEQVRNFFRISLKHGLILDLLDTNLRTREDGTVVLIDFVEEPKDGLLSFIKLGILSWCQLFASKNGKDRLQTEKFFDDFTNGFDEYQSMSRGELAEIKKWVLNDIFFVVRMLEQQPLASSGSI